jgi:branched-chain amino acid transport system ATP-binding protein
MHTWAAVMKLEMADVYASYQRDLFILRGVDFSAAQGKVTIVIGPNGSGKSTMLKSIAGILKPKKGTIHLDGQDITGIELDEIIQLGISYIPQERAVFPQMSVTENLELGCWIFRKERAKVRKQVNWALERFPALTDKARLLAGTMSGGLQRILDIAKALLTNPSLLLVDEPTVGLSPLVAQMIYTELSALKAEGRTILLVDQDVRSAMKIADYVYVLELGKVKAHGPREAFEGRLGEVVRSWLI